MSAVSAMLFASWVPRVQACKRPLILALACFFAGFSSVVAQSQSWADKYPKLLCGAAGSSPDPSFKIPGSGIPMGEARQDVIIRFKVRDAESATYFTQESVTIDLQLSSFMGGDNVWSTTSPDLRAVYVDASGAVSSAMDRPSAMDISITWKATTSTLTLMFRKLAPPSQIAESELAIVLAAPSFSQGGGPIAPRCLERDAPIFVSEFLSGTTKVPGFLGRISSVAPVGCFGRALRPFGVMAPSWGLKRIGQIAEKNGVGMVTTITVTLASKVDIYSVTASVKSEVVISGLTGSLTPDSNTLQIAAQISCTRGSIDYCPLKSDVFSAFDLFQSPVDQAGSNTGMWKQQPGTLTLTIKDDRAVPAGIPFVFSFSLKLPASPSSPPSVYVSAKTGSSIMIPPQLMDLASGDSAPLSTRQRSFIVASIGQQSTGGGQENQISITLMSNFDVQSTPSYISRITISGIIGSASQDSSLQYPFPVISESRDSVMGIFSDGSTLDRAKWLSSKGELILEIKDGQVLRAGTEYVFSVKLLNEISPQSSPRIYIQASGETNTDRIEMQRGEGNNAPFFISQPTLSIAMISQSTTSVGAVNTLTISLQSNVGIQAVTGGQTSGPLTITGLVGFKDPSGPIPVTNKGFNSIEDLFAGNAARWDKATGKLIFDIASDRQLAASKLYVFSVDFKNPDFAQDSPAITIEFSGILSTALKLIQIEKGSKSSYPLQIDAPTFKVLRIGQKYCGTGILNELTVTLKANLLLDKGYSFTIEGLKGSGTGDNVALPLTGCNDTFSSSSGVRNAGSWRQSSGTLILISAKGISDGTVMICSFSLLNPTELRAAAKVSITVNSFGTGQAQQVTKVIGPEIFRNAPSKSAPFMVLPATFITAKIGQTRPYPGETNNLIGVTIQSNVEIGSPGGIVSAITITGLTGSETSDNRRLPLFSDPFVKDVAATAIWTKASGTLIISIGASKTMKANTLYTFSFSLANPMQQQQSPAVSISYEQALSSTAMERDLQGCIHAVGDTAPLFVYTRDFLMKRIGIKASWPRASNSISITIISSASLSSASSMQTSIVVSGLSFETRFDPALPITSSDPPLFGTSVEWNEFKQSSNGATEAKEGQLVIKLSYGSILRAGIAYQIDIPMKNGVDETTWKPKISVNGLAQIFVSDMEYGGQASPIEVEFTTQEPKRDVGMTITFTTIQKISMADSIIVMLPGFKGSSTITGENIWGVQSDPPVFTIESNDVEYIDSVAASVNVARAIYRVGTSSRTKLSSSSENGEDGSIIFLDTEDRSVFGKENVYAGMQISIDGSDIYHNIYQQTGSSSGQPAVAYFYPKYKVASREKPNLYPSVSAGTAYVIHSQVEVTAKRDVCAGTKVTITIPSGSGIVTPDAGIPKDIPIRLSQVRTGFSTAAIGTPDSITSLNNENRTGLQVELVGSPQVALDLPTSYEYQGLPWAPTNIPPKNNFVFVDGFRSILRYNPTDRLALLLRGYGPVKKTELYCDPQTGTGDEMCLLLKGTTLQHWRNIDADSNDIWLTLSSGGVSAIRPALVKGSYVQLQNELLRFTGELASAVLTFAPPTKPGKECILSGERCSSTNTCGSIIFTGCSDNPSVSVIFVNGSISSLQVNYGGACTDSEKVKLKGTLTLSSGVQCDETPADQVINCGTECTVDWSDKNVIKVKRTQFSTSAASLICTKASPCSDWIKSSTVYLKDLGLDALLYTSSSKELGLVNQQSIKILNPNKVADTVVGGDHVVSVTAPQTVGTKCQKVIAGVKEICKDGVQCATISFAGCSVNPQAIIIFSNGAISDVRLDGSLDTGRFGQSICQRGETLIGTIRLENGVECDVKPACGTGCQALLDPAKDTLIIKHRMTRPVNDTDVVVATKSDVVRVHTPLSNVGYQILLVPPTLCTVSSNNLLPGQCAPSPKAGSVVKWMDPATGSILASMYATQDGLASLCLDLLSSGSGNNVLDWAVCDTSCQNTTTNGDLIASKPVLISLRYLNNNITDISVVLTMPITFNKAYGNLSGESTALVSKVSGSRRAATANFEYRLNGNCTCPASANSSVNCTIRESGLYQASLMKTDKCNAVGGRDMTSIIVASVLGGLAGLLCFLFVLYAFCRLYRKKRAEQSSITKDITKDRLEQSSEVEEGPIYVGRPVPVTPTMQPHGTMSLGASQVPLRASPVPLIMPLVPAVTVTRPPVVTPRRGGHELDYPPMSSLPAYGSGNFGASPVLPTEAGSWDNSNSFQLAGPPATYTPAARPDRSPFLSKPRSMPGPHNGGPGVESQRRGTRDASSSPPRTREHVDFSSSPQAPPSRVPYGV